MPEDISKALSSTRKEKVSDNNNPQQQPLPTIMVSVISLRLRSNPLQSVILRSHLIAFYKP
jgi:hypothetical protein